MGKLYSSVSKLALLVSATVSWGSGQAAADDLPQGGAVVAGDASLNQVSPGQLVIDQSTESAIINWQSFNIGADNHVHFNQPGPASATLNRVTGDTSSNIAGLLTATGSVLLVNPNGIAIHNGAVIDTGGFIASSLDIADADFLSGNLTFRNGGQAGLVSNAGTIRVANGGGAALIGGRVSNQGMVEAYLGRVAFAAGDLVTVDFSGDGFLSVGVSESDLASALGAPGASLDALVSAGGIVRADGGRILISAGAAAGLMLNAVHVPGDMIARSVSLSDGRVILGGVDIDAGAGDIRLGGAIDVSGAQGGAINVSTDGGLLTAIGALDARGASRGGSINLRGGAVALGGAINADGADGGAISVESDRNLSLAELVSARGLFGAGGSISYRAGSGVIETTTSVSDVSGRTQGGVITMHAGGDIFSSGQYRAASAHGLGGQIDITAPNVSLYSASYDASGASRGGLVRIGGAFRGGEGGDSALSHGFETRFGALDPLSAATSVFLNDSSRINVSSADGAGGAAVVWSTDQTTMLAGIDASGASAGGFVEISSSGVLRHTNLAGVNPGAGGTLLLDPKNIVIGDLVAAADWQYAGLVDGSMGTFGGALPGTPLPGSHEFGRSIAINADGTLLAMGVRGNSGFANNRPAVGAVHLFSMNAGFSGAAYVGTVGVDYSGGNHIPVFLTDLDFFGTSVALNAAGNRLAIGAPWANSEVTGDSGAVYLFSFGTNTNFTGGSQIGFIGVEPIGPIPSYNVAGLVQSEDLFGTGLAFNAAGDRLAVGAALDDGFGASGFLEYGAVHLFAFDDANFTNPDYVGTIGHGYTGTNDANLAGFLDTGDQFGTSASLNAAGNLLAAGSHSDQGFSNSAANGAVLLFTFTSSDFTAGVHVGTIGRGYTGGKNVNTAGYVADGAIFGYDVELNAAGDRLVVATPFDSGSGGAAVESGAVRIYDFTDASFSGGALVSTFGYGYAGPGDIDLSVGGLVAAGSQFGHSVGVTAAGDRIAAGFRGGGNGGGARFFTSEPSTVGDLLFADNAAGTSYISVANLAAALSTGASVVFEASNDIELLADLLVDNPGVANGGNLSLIAGRRITIGANIFSDNGAVSLYANTHNGSAATVNANREPGLALISMDGGASINAGSGQVVIGLMSGAGLTDSSSGDVRLGSISASRIEVFNAGPTASSDINILSGSVLTGSGSGRAIELRAETGRLINNSGVGAFAFTGGGHYGVFSGDPATTTEGVLGYLKRYNVANALAFDAADPGASYFAYRIAPFLTVAAQNAGRIYGDPNPLFSSQITGFIDGDTAGGSLTGAPSLTTAAGASTGIGNYPIVAGQGDLASVEGYQFTFVNGQLAITPRAITITADNLGKTYGNTDPALTVSVGGFGLAGGDTQATALTGVATRAPGESVAGSPYVINPNGVTATSNYSVTYFNGAFTITPRAITITADNLSKIYGNTDPALTVSVGGLGLANGDTQATALTGVAARAPGENVAGSPYVITPNGVTATSNYVVTYANGAFTITPRAITITADNLGKIYGNTDPALTVSVGGLGLANGDTQATALTGVATRAPGENVTGSPYVINPNGVTATSNYSVTYANGAFTITPRSITITADDLGKIYGNTDPMLTVTVGGDGLANGDTQSSAFTGAPTRVAGEATGTYAIDANTVDAGANYSVAYIDGVFTITPRAITVTADDLGKIYGNTDPTLTVSVSGDGLANGDTVAGAFTGAPTRVAGENAGTYAIDASTVDAGANYDVTFVDGVFTITPRSITITADDLGKIYGNTDPSLTVSVGGAGLANGDTQASAFTGAPVRGAGQNVGTYVIDANSVDAGANYAVTYVDGTFTITPRSITITADDLGKIYGNTDPSLTVSVGGMGLVSGDVLTGAANRGAGQNVGTYAIDASGVSAGSNYAVTYVDGVFTITPRSIAITANDLSRMYGNTDPALTVSVGGMGLASGDSLSGSATRAPGSNVGTYAIDSSGVTAGANYVVAYANGVFTITPRPITITLDDLQKQFGEADPALTYSISSGSLVSGDMLTGAPTRQPGEAAGHQYAITGGTLMAGGNYTLTLVNGVLTIIPLPDSSPSQSLTNGDGSQASQTVEFDLTGENSPTGVLSFNTAAGSSSTSDSGNENCLASQAGVCVVAQ